MDMLVNYDNEQQAAIAFNRQSVVFDKLYAGDRIIQYKRERVLMHLQNCLMPESNILELNAGTGDDAICLAQNGHHVHATDISEGMQSQLRQKVSSFGLDALISSEVRSYTSLNLLEKKGPYDCIFSNFAGLNCTDELHRVLENFEGLLKPGGIVVLVVLPRFCLWETLLVFKGKFKTATRRFFSSKGRKANIEGASFNCWYYPAGYISRQLKDKFGVIKIEGLCTIVPPSYINNFSEKYPKIFSYLCRAEEKLKDKWPWKYIGDYYIISLIKK